MAGYALRTIDRPLNDKDEPLISALSSAMWLSSGGYHHHHGRAPERRLSPPEVRRDLRLAGTTGTGLAPTLPSRRFLGPGQERVAPVAPSACACSRRARDAVAGGI